MTGGSAMLRRQMRRVRRFDHECSGRREEGIVTGPLDSAPAAHPLTGRSGNDRATSGDRLAAAARVRSWLIVSLRDPAWGKLSRLRLEIDLAFNRAQFSARKCTGFFNTDP